MNKMMTTITIMFTALGLTMATAQANPNQRPAEPSVKMDKKQPQPKKQANKKPQSKKQMDKKAPPKPSTNKKPPVKKPMDNKQENKKPQPKPERP